MYCPEQIVCRINQNIKSNGIKKKEDEMKLNAVTTIHSRLIALLFKYLFRYNVYNSGVHFSRASLDKKKECPTHSAFKTPFK